MPPNREADGAARSASRSNAAPRSLRREALDDRVRLLLPARGIEAPGGRFVVAIGILLTAPALAPLVLQLDAPSLSGAFIALLGILIGGMPYALRYAATEVVVTADRIRVVDRLGRLRWARTCRRARIERLGVDPFRIGWAGPGRQTGELCGAVVAETGPDTRFRFALGYRVAVVRELAVALSAELDVALDDSVSQFDPAHADAQVAPDVDLDVPPEGSRVVLERNAAGLLLRVPPRGVWRASWSLLLFVGGWYGILALPTVASLRATSPSEAIPLGVLAAFWIVGLAPLGLAVHLGRRRVTFAIVDGNLLFRRSGLLGSRSREIDGAEVLSITVGDSPSNNHGKRDQEIHVDLPRERLGFGSGRDVGELRWIAAVLQAALRRDAASA